MEDKKTEDYLVRETDGTFFENMRQMERRILTKYGDTEALAILDEEDRIEREEYEEELRQEMEEEKISKKNS